MITAKFYTRDFQDSVLPTPELKAEVKRYSNHAVGGPFEAMIEVTGNDLDIWELLEYLRRPVEIIADEGDAVWWGYVAQVDLVARNPYSQIPQRVRVGVSLDDMYNRVAVAYEVIDFNTYAGTRATTAWADDTESQDEYGVKEGLFSGESASDATLAEQARDIMLARRKYPIPVIELNASETEAKAEIFCRGWWGTMSWVYAQVAATLALSVTWYTSEDTFGKTTTEKICQTFRPTGGDINLKDVILRLGAFGTPTDNVELDLYSVTTDVSGSKIPNVLIASASVVDGGTLSSTWTFETFTFAPEQLLTNNTDYALVFSRSGAMDDVDYYKITVDTLYRYPGGDYARFQDITVTSEDYTATTISFDAATDQIRDSANGFTIFQVGDIITVTGSDDNDGTYTILTVAVGALGVNAALTDEAAGDSVVILITDTWNSQLLDAAFQLYQNALIQTSTQVINLITNHNQFFNIIESDVASGVTSESYRDGDGTAQFEVEQLLQHGTDNLRRMLVKVDRDRNILLYEEPEETDANKYNLYTDGTLLDPYGSVIRQTEARAGIWTRLADIIPNTVNVQYLNNATDRFIEITEYDVTEKKTHYTARDELNPFEIGRPYDG